MRLGPSHLVLRPHFLKLGPTSGDAAAPAVVTHVEFLGASVRYGLDMRGVLLSADRPFEGSAALFRPGDQVFVTLPFEKAVWLD